jgi:hypothetical protein
MIDRTNEELEGEVQRSLRGHAPHFLAPGGRSGNGHGYLTRPPRGLPLVADQPETAARIGEARTLADEPEAPSEAWVDAEAELAVERNRVRHLVAVAERREMRRELSVEDRIRDAVRRAKVQRVDISRDLFVIRKMLTRAEQAGTRNPQAALGRLEGVEAKLDGLPETAR